MINNRNTGPTALPPSVLSAMAQQPLSHRSNRFREAFADVTAQLAKLVNAPEPALLLSCSGTGALEASIASIVHAESRVLVLTAGYYGDLLARIAGGFTENLDILRFESGEGFDPAGLESSLMHTRYDAVLLTHSESSTGIYHPVAAVIAVIRANSDALILVDTISSLGATPIDMAVWGADILVGATQKGLMAPAGMAVVCLSIRAQQHIEQCPARHNYMHLRPWLEAGRQHSVPYTPAVNVFQGLQAAIALIFAEGLAARYQRHRQASSRCRAFFADSEHVRCFAPSQYASHSITALFLSAALSASAIKKRLEDEHQTVVSTGPGPLSERVIRIGHMGHFTSAEIDDALQAIKRVIAQEKAHMEIKCLHSITQIDPVAYQDFHQQASGNIFYDYRFLLALEERPLLPHLKTYYLTARQGNTLRGWLPVYLQTDVDPFGVLAESLSYPFNSTTRALFSHAMHVSDSALLHTGNPARTIQPLLAALDDLAQEEQVSSYGLLNLSAENARSVLQYASGWQNNAMWNRFSCDLRSFSNLEQIIAGLNAEGRREANRQLRKFQRSAGKINWLPVSAVDLNEVTRLCQQTTVRNGTPHYYPPEAVRHLLQRTEAFTRIVEVRQDEQLAGVGIVFIDGKKLHLWAVGMDYTAADFSPYTVLYLDIYSYALANGFETFEAGRTTQRIKERLGFRAVPLYSITKSRGACV